MFHKKRLRKDWQNDLKNRDAQKWEKNDSQNQTRIRRFKKDEIHMMYETKNLDCYSIYLNKIITMYKRYYKIEINWKFKLSMFYSLLKDV